MIRRALAALSVTAFAVVALATAAFAHVSVTPTEAPRGGFSTLMFRVPTESDTASTVKFELAFPDPRTQGLASVAVQPKVGWTHTVTRIHLTKPIASDDGEVSDVVGLITWTADPGAGIKPGEFDEFDVSVGPLPSTGSSMVFKAVQTYSDGQVVRWIEEQTGKTEPEHPAPTVTLTAPSSAKQGDNRDGGARALAIAGVALGAVALVSSWRRARAR